MEMRQELPVRNGMPRRVTVLPWGSRKGGWRTQLWAGGKLSSPGGTAPALQRLMWALLPGNTPAARHAASGQGSSPLA